MVSQVYEDVFIGGTLIDGEILCGNYRPQKKLRSRLKHLEFQRKSGIHR